MNSWLKRGKYADIKKLAEPLDNIFLEFDNAILT